MKIELYPESKSEYIVVTSRSMVFNHSLVTQLSEVRALKGLPLEISVVSAATPHPKVAVYLRLQEMITATRESGYPDQASTLEDCLEELLSEDLVSAPKI
ncbi:hypothetical protein [Vibrio phage V-YDF132]|nr:hypothetical protein [Vibrio phage V-YDF132]